MAYDRFEEDWNGIPLPFAGSETRAGTLFASNGKHQPVTPALPEESLSVPIQYRQRPASEKKATFTRFICCEWMARASKLPKAAILAGNVIWHKAGLEKDNFVKDGMSESKPLKLNSHLRKRLNVSPSQMSRGIRALEDAGLVRRLETRSGKLQVVVLINVWLNRQKTESANATTFGNPQGLTEQPSPDAPQPFSKSLPPRNKRTY